MEKKNYSKQEKLKILKEASEKGLKPTLEKYSLYPTTYYYWKRKYFVSGEQGCRIRLVFFGDCLQLEFWFDPMQYLLLVIA